MERRYCDAFRPVDEDAYLRDFIRAVEHRDLEYVQFIFPIIKEQQKLVATEVDECGHYIELTREDTHMYDRVLEHGLILSSHHGCLPITKYLLANGVNVNAQNEAGATALIKACERGHEHIVRCLMEHDADINQTDLVGSTALQWVTRMAEQWVNIVDLLLSHKNILVNQTSHKRARTALHCAAENDLTGQMCKSLLDKSATVNITDCEGASPLHLAAHRGFVWNVKLLVEYGAHINMQTNHFELSALHIAMQQGHVETVELLLKSGADIDINDLFGESAVGRMKRYAGVTTDVCKQQQFSDIETFVSTQLAHVKSHNMERMKAMFNVLCELISETDQWTPLFLELFQCREGNSDELDEATSSLPLRTSEASLSVLLLHLFNVWLDDFPRTATFWILMRALRDHGMSPLADKMVEQYAV